MRGKFDSQAILFTAAVNLDDRVRADHPLRAIKQMADEDLGKMGRRFNAAYAKEGRPSVPPERLITALSLLDRIKKRFKIRPKTIGADKGYDQGPFLSELEKRTITPHVAVKDGAIGGASGTRYRKENADSIKARQRMRRRTQSKNYGISQRCRKKIEELFGWAKTIGGLARTRLIGHSKTNQQAHLAAAAFNLIRMRTLAD